MMPLLLSGTMRFILFCRIQHRMVGFEMSCFYFVFICTGVSHGIWVLGRAFRASGELKFVIIIKRES